MGVDLQDKLAKKPRPRLIACRKLTSRGQEAISPAESRRRNFSSPLVSPHPSRPKRASLLSPPRLMERPPAGIPTRRTPPEGGAIRPVPLRPTARVVELPSPTRRASADAGVRVYWALSASTNPWGDNSGFTTAVRAQQAEVRQAEAASSVEVAKRKVDQVRSDLEAFRASSAGLPRVKPRSDWLLAMSTDLGLNRAFNEDNVVGGPMVTPEKGTQVGGVGWTVLTAKKTCPGEHPRCVQGRVGPL
jgi:hypothetical protein